MDPKQLRKLYTPLVPKLHHILQQVSQTLSDLPPSDFQVETDIKPYPSVKRKVLADRVYHPQELSDLVRGRIYFSPQFQFEEVINIIHQLFGDQIKHIQKKNNSEHGLEYHGVIHADLNIDGINFELQLIPAEYQPYTDLLHKIYELIRNPKHTDKLTDIQQQFLKKTHNKLHKLLHQRAKDNRS